MIGVMILGLVLTISGLAFFSLGSYEAALFQERWGEEQAFCLAESGAERARWILATTWSKSLAQVDSAGMDVTVVEIDGAGQPVREGQDQIDFLHDVLVLSTGAEGLLEQDVEVIFTPGLDYAASAEQNFTFYGSNNDGSWTDFFDLVNDVYIEGTIKYGSQLNGADPNKYDQAVQEAVPLPAYFQSLSAFEARFKSLAQKVYNGNKTFGRSGLTRWNTIGDNRIIYVDGNVTITENVHKWWDKSLDATIIATGNITVKSPLNDDDDRLVLIALNNVEFVGAGILDEVNAVIYAGNNFSTKGLLGDTPGGGGIISGFVKAKNIDMRGYDPIEGWPLKQGWDIHPRAETVLMNGGISVFQSEFDSLPLSLNRRSWAENNPGS